jgi:hypothetical protein
LARSNHLLPTVSILCYFLSFAYQVLVIATDLSSDSVPTNCQCQVKNISVLLLAGGLQSHSKLPTLIRSSVKHHNKQ